jgi:DKNYY family
MRGLFFIFPILFLSSCFKEKQNNKVKEKSPKVETSFHYINSFGSIKKDTTKFVKLNCGLYINKNGTLAYKALDYSNLGSKDGSDKIIEVYLTTIYNADLSDTIHEGSKEMKFVVDTTTFTIINSFYFKDKNYIYNFSPMWDGGSINLNSDIDLKTFQILECELYAKDKNHCYHRGNIIEGADLKSFQVLDTGYSYQIAYDKKYYFLGGEQMELTEVKKLNLEAIRKKKNGL